MRKHILRSAFAMSALCTLGLFTPHLYWGVVGWTRDESFYAGKPTSYWREFAQEEYANGSWRPVLWSMYISGSGNPYPFVMNYPVVCSYTSTLLAIPAPPATPTARLRNTLFEWKDVCLPARRLKWSDLEADPDAAGVLRELFGDADARVRAAAAMTLVRHEKGVKEVLPALIHYFMLAEDDVAEAMLSACIADKDAIPLLCKRLDADDKSANRATRALNHFRGDAREAMPALLKNLEKENCCGAAAALSAVGPEAFPHLKALLKSKNVHARRNAALALSLGFDPDVPERIALLVGQLEDEDTNVRQFAFNGLTQKVDASPDVFPALLAMMRDPSPELRVHAMNVFQNMGPRAKAAIADLRDLAVSDDSAAARTAARATLKALVPAE